jgi:DNA-binding MarR family transcriptional regulator
VAEFVRNSHIFASAVHEILEEQPLRAACPDPLSIPQFHLLRLLSLNGRHQVGEAAEFLGVSPPAATKNIDKLEALGLLVRRPAPADRRAMLLVVSPKGRRLVRKYDELKSARLADLLRRFQPDEIARIARILERLSVSLFSKGPAGDGICLRCAAYIQDDCPVGQIHGGCPYQKMRRARAAGNPSRTRTPRDAKTREGRTT